MLPLLPSLHTLFRESSMFGSSWLPGLHVALMSLHGNIQWLSHSTNTLGVSCLHPALADRPSLERGGGEENKRMDWSSELQRCASPADTGPSVQVQQWPSEPQTSPTPRKQGYCKNLGSTGYRIWPTRLPSEPRREESKKIRPISKLP